MAERAPLTAKSVRLAEDEAKWLSVAAGKGGVSQNDLIRLALIRLRKDLGAANRIKPEMVLAAAKASKYKLSPARGSGQPAPNVNTKPGATAADGAPRARTPARKS
jgi:hypothetical protein